MAPSGEYIKQALGKVGIDVELRNIDLGGFIKRVYSDYDFDMTINVIYAMPDPTIGVQRLYWSKNIKQGVPFANVSGLLQPRDGQGRSRARRPRTTGQAQGDVRQPMQQIAARDVPLTGPVRQSAYFTLANKRVHESHDPARRHLRDFLPSV